MKGNARGDRQTGGVLSGRRMIGYLRRTKSKLTLKKKREGKKYFDNKMG